MAAAASGVHGAGTKSKPTKKTISPSHKQRLRKKANSWGQPDTPNKGLVLVTQQTDLSEAAAGLTKELKQGVGELCTSLNVSACRSCCA